MPWSRGGTVAVTQNSTTVTGTGTGFVASGRVGDAFLGPDGRWYEVTNIASDTALSILPAYLGATANGGVYAIAPMQGYVKQSADALRALVNQFGGVLAVLGAEGTPSAIRDSLGLGAVSTENVLPVAKGGTGGASQADARSGLGLGSVAIESTVPVSKGGTGVTTINALLSALNGVGNYARSNIVGSVGQSSGVPTGAVIESGSNSNGAYTKFADGTLICSGISPSSLTTNTAGGNVFHSAVVVFTFPLPFVGNVPRITSGVLTTANYYSWSAMEGNVSANLTGTAFRLVSPVGNAVGYICYTAIGRWF